MRQAAKDYNAGKINLAEFTVQMAELIKSANILTASVGKGGYKRMTTKDWGRVGAKTRQQYAYINNFVRQIEQGKLSGIQIENRASLYAKQSRAGFFKTEMETAIDAGLTEARRTQNSREGCVECNAYDGVWLPIEEMPPIGELICGQFCLCFVEYR